MTQTLTALFLAFFLVAGSGFCQQPDRPSVKNRKMKTVRIHIDGFSKSKSGAV